jgi:hypothetical protein
MLMMLIYWAKNTSPKEKQRSFVSCWEGYCLVVNAEKTKYVLKCCEQNVGHSHNIKIVDKFSESVAKFGCSGTAIINQRAFM